jgi:hypothetical protein
VAFFPAPNPDGGLWFHHLDRSAGLGVGRHGGGRGRHVAPAERRNGRSDCAPWPASLGSAAKIAEIRAQILAAVTAAGARRNTAFAWGRMAEDAVLLLDPGPVEPASAGPVGTYQTGARGRLTYVRRADHTS